MSVVCLRLVSLSLGVGDARLLLLRVFSGIFTHREQIAMLERLPLLRTLIELLARGRLVTAKVV